MTTTHTCTTCGKQGAPRYRGIREGNPRCDQCYASERKAIRRAKKKRERITMYNMWGE